MLLVEHDDMVDTLSTDGPDQAFDSWILPRRSRRRPLNRWMCGDEFGSVKERCTDKQQHCTNRGHFTTSKNRQHGLKTIAEASRAPNRKSFADKAYGKIVIGRASWRTHVSSRRPVFTRPPLAGFNLPGDNSVSRERWRILISRSIRPSTGSRSMTWPRVASFARRVTCCCSARRERANRTSFRRSATRPSRPE